MDATTQRGGVKKAATAMIALWVAKQAFNMVSARQAARDARRRSALCKEQGFKVAIIGAGMSGICMAIKLQEAGIPFTIFELGSDFGGTWAKNNFPDSACDVPSHWYSYSFEYKHDWTRVWEKQPEILAYFCGVAAKYGLRAHTRFNVVVNGAELDISQGRECWTVEFEENGMKTTERFSAFVSAVGQLDTIKIPKFRGVENFAGKSFHTAKWDYSVNIKGKNVIGVGTGPSAIQAFPAIAKEVKQLTVLQRTPVWCMPKNDYAYSMTTRWLLQNVPYLLWIKRLAIAMQLDLAYLALIPTSRVTDMNMWIRSKLTRQIKINVGEEKWAKHEKELTPDYPLGCKRIALSSDWHPMIRRDNVHLQTSEVKQVLPNAVEFNNGDIVPCDVIIYATGFETASFLGNCHIRIKGGCSLQEYWADVPKAYKSVAVSGFPNFFMLFGPGSNLGHSSIIHQTERQAEYITELLKFTVDSGVSTLDVKKEIYEANFDELQRNLKLTVFDSDACDSWYKTKAGVVVNNWSSTSFRFFLQMRDVDLDAYNQGPSINSSRKLANSNL